MIEALGISLSPMDRLLIDAWRECWPDVVFMRQLRLRIEITDENIEQLSSVLLHYSTLSEMPNRLMLKYLKFCLDTQVVPSVTFLNVVNSYRSYEKVECINEILPLVIYCFEKLNCDFCDANVCVRTSILVMNTVLWILAYVDYLLTANNFPPLSHFLSLVFTLKENKFVQFCNYFVCWELSEFHDQIKASIRNIKDKIEANRQLIQPDLSDNMLTFLSFLDIEKNSYNNLFSANRNEILAQSVRASNSRIPSVVISLSGIFAHVQSMKGIAAMVEALKVAKDIQGESWLNVIHDLIMGGILQQHDDSTTLPFSVSSSYLYLRIPRLLSQLVAEDVPKETLLGSLRRIATSEAVLNISDTKARCNTLQAFLNVLSELGILQESEKDTLMAIRDEMRKELYVQEGQPTINLVLRAEFTLQSIVKAFDAHQALERWPQMLNTMMSGKSLLYICAAAISIDQLNLLAERLIKITETYKEVVPVVEDAQKSVPPSHDLFDMSFLLLHRLSQYYSTTTCLRPGDPFFKTWYFSSAIDLVRNMFDPADLPQLLNNVPLDLELASDVLSRLRVGQPGWLNIRTWYCIIDLIPSIVQLVLNEVLLDTISIEELKHIFSGLLFLNIHGVSCMCSPLLCFAQYVALQKTDEATKLANSLFSFFESITPSDAERNRQTDRQTFMVNSAKKLFSAYRELPVTLMHVLRMNRAPPQLTHSSDDHFPVIGKPENIRSFFAASERAGYLTAALIARIIVLVESEQYDSWLSAFIEALQKVNTMQGMEKWCNLNLACCFIKPKECTLALIPLLSNYVLHDDRDLFCVAPRGNILAFFLVKLYLIALRHTNATDVDKAETAGCSMDEYSLQNNTNSTADRTAVIASLRELFNSKFEVVRSGELCPTVAFVSNFLYCLSEYSTPEAELIKNEIPMHLIFSLLRADPDILSMRTVLRLFDLKDEIQRRKALQTAFLLKRKQYI
ncbi:Mediator of RNA polymerase II transcription subunit 24 [Trichinella papuae]|uniref:Mediator of RNA polymerase II transcription subunit 24 n=1 Tax=Trichinella papuae TaxID=268474 RepID=A0A0V1MB39_9BILA|nr:Mediator of RNA polymerase II transcription subunit 24 [Trichinella papuae]